MPFHVFFHCWIIQFLLHWNHLVFHIKVYEHPEAILYRNPLHKLTNICWYTLHNSYTRKWFFFRYRQLYCYNSSFQTKKKILKVPLLPNPTQISVSNFNIKVRADPLSLLYLQRKVFTQKKNGLKIISCQNFFSSRWKRGYCAQKKKISDFMISVAHVEMKCQKNIEKKVKIH